MAHTGLRVRTFLAHAAHDLSLEFRMLTERLIGKLKDLLRQVDELEAAKVPPDLCALPFAARRLEHVARGSPGYSRALSSSKLR